MLTCPECHQDFLYLTIWGSCLHCQAPLFSRYMAIYDDREWIKQPDNFEQSRELVRATLRPEQRVKLLTQYTWI